MKRITSLFSILALALVTMAATPTSEARVAWNVDSAHTMVGFSVKHFFTPVQGQFDEFDAQVYFDPTDLSSSSVEVTIPVASVNTNNDRRDTHLMSEDFFDAENFPYITFKSTSVREAGLNQYVVVGDLTIRDVTREVELPVTLLGVQELEGEMSQMFGGITQVASFEGGLTINRNDFGVGSGSWAATAVVGGDVNIQLAVETNR
jgi:polyisoprenoid-binding protein YceI